MRSLLIGVLFLVLAISGIGLFIYAADISSETDEKGNASKEWVRNYAPYKRKEDYEKNVFKIIHDIHAECGITKQTLKELFVFLNTFLSEEDKKKLVNCKYDLELPLQLYLKQHSNLLNRQSGAGFRKGAFIFSVWALKRVAHSKLPGPEIREKNYREFVQYVDSLLPIIRTSIQKLLGDQYKPHKETINREISSFVKTINYKFRVLQSDPLYPLFKNGIRAAGKGVERIREKLQSMKGLKFMLIMADNKEEKIVRYIQGLDVDILRELSACEMSRMMHRNTDHGMTISNPVGDRPHYWPASFAMPLTPEDIQQLDYEE